MIAIQGLSKHFGSVAVLHGITLNLPPESVTVIQGPSGSGKTTLLRIIAGLESPDEGEIHIDGKLVTDPALTVPPHQRGIGFVFQDAALWPHMTVYQNVAFGLLGQPRRDVARLVNEVLSSLELTGLARRYASQISGGQARRVSIARTLVTRPKHLLLDEPLTHIHPELKALLVDLIRQQAEVHGCTVLYVTHSPAEAEQLGGRHLTMTDGRITSVDPVSDDRADDA